MKHVKWLMKELPSLLEAGILNEETARRLEAHYKKETPVPGLFIFGAIGGVLTGLGVILLLAFNWNTFSRPFRIFMAFLPLVVSQVLSVLWLLKKRYDSPGFREGGAVFMLLASGGAIALVGQVYHIPGNLASFLGVWMVLSLPLVYLSRSRLTALLYMIGITAWAGYRQAQGGEAVLFWIFFTALVPFFVLERKTDPGGGIFFEWTAGICLTVALGITLEKILPGTWIVVYSLFFALLYLAGRLWYPGAGVSNPFHLLGSLGIVVMAFLLTYSWPWEDIGWEFARYGGRFDPRAGIVDYVLSGLLLGCFIFFLVLGIRKKKKINFLYAFFPVLILAGYLSVSADTEKLLFLHLLMNLYILGMGVISIIQGVQARRSPVVNGGVLTISLLIALRFVFVEDMFENLVARGLIFILLGVCFIGVNLFISRKVKKEVHIE